jgi:hypothetical protein
MIKHRDTINDLFPDKVSKIKNQCPLTQWLYNKFLVLTHTRCFEAGKLAPNE